MSTLLLAAGLGLGAAGAAYCVAAPQSRAFLPVVCRGPAAGNRVALTFDDGPCPAGTGPILDILRARSVPAAFFVIGAHAQSHPALLRRMHEEGHLIGNHTFDHHRLGMFGRARYWHAQLELTSRVVERVTGAPPALFRPPMGVKTPWMARPVRSSRMTPVCWSLRAKDGVATTRDRILRRLVTAARCGDIILLHDGHEPTRPRDLSATVDALPQLIEALRARGLVFERLDRLLRLPPCLPPATAHAAHSPDN